MVHPLANFPITSTGNVDEAQSVLSRELAGLRIKKARDTHAFRLDMNGVHLNRSLLGFNRFNTETLVDPGVFEGGMLLAIGVGEPTVFYIDGEPVVCDDKGAVLTPSKKVVIHRSAGSGLILIKTEFDAIVRRLTDVLGHLPGKPVDFDRSVDLTASVGAQARQVVQSLVTIFGQDSTLLEHALIRAGFDDLLLNTLLALPSNYSDELMGGNKRPTVAPAVVRKTEEFLESNAGKPITITDLLKRFDCSRAALFSAYRRYRGYTPMQFLTECRLKSARTALLSPSSGDTVSTIAYNYGFHHLGRFSTAYRKRFGETPSETLRKA